MTVNFFFFWQCLFFSIALVVGLQCRIFSTRNVRIWLNLSHLCLRPRAEQRARRRLGGFQRIGIARDAGQDQSTLDDRDHRERRLLGLCSGQPSARSRSVTAKHQPPNARADASRTCGLAFTDSVAIGSIGQPSR